MSKSTLKSILNVTGSQCKDLRTGVICSDFMVLVSILAAGAQIGFFNWGGTKLSANDLNSIRYFA